MRLFLVVSLLSLILCVASRPSEDKKDDEVVLKASFEETKEVVIKESTIKESEIKEKATEKVEEATVDKTTAKEASIKKVITEKAEEVTVDKTKTEKAKEVETDKAKEATIDQATSIKASTEVKSRESKSDKKNDLELKLVHVIFRHGYRTPADTYPTDPYINHEMEPYGWGQLTNQGRVQLFDNGKFLRTRYEEFLGKNFKPEEVHAQATGLTRTRMSLQLLLAGMFPPKDTPLEWNRDLNWLPIVYSYEELANDSLLLVRKTCPRYHEELERVLAVDAKKEIDDNKILFDELSNFTGMAIKTPEDVQSLYSTLKAEEEYGLKLPQWTENYFPHKLESLTDKSYVYNAYNDELKRLKGGVFVKKAINDWDKKSDEKLKTKIFLYGGHDSTVTNILSAFNVWEQQFPVYGITTMLEFSKHKQTGEFGVEIFLRNSTKVEPHPLTIPGCAQFCPLKDVKKLLKNTIPQNWEEECKAKNEHFTEPTLVGA